MTSIIKRVNATKLSPDLLNEAVAFIADLPVEDRSDFEGRTISLLRFLDEKGASADRPDILLAINFRLEALARIMVDGGAKGWRLAGNTTDHEWVHEEVIRAAAEEPLIEREGRAAFEFESFHQRLLSIAKTAGTA